MLGPVVEATATMTLALPKQRQRNGAASSVVDELYLADIEILFLLYSRPPLELVVPNVFARGDLVRLR